MVVGRFKIEVAMGCVCAETVVNVSKHVSLSIPINTREALLLRKHIFLSHGLDFPTVK